MLVRDIDYPKCPELEKLFAHFPRELRAERPVKGVSGEELINPMKTLLTPEEAADLARRIEEGRPNRHD